MEQLLRGQLLYGPFPRNLIETEQSAEEVMETSDWKLASG